MAYSGQCYISHAHTGRSANRGDCSQACRLPYHVTDAQGRFIAHDKHVLSMKDNNQSDNLEALIDAGVRSFKIEGRYKDLAFVKNITGHYRQLIDRLIEDREDSRDPDRPPLARASAGTTRLFFTPDPNQNFNREFTDYFVNGRQQGIDALDSPKNPGVPVAEILKVGDRWVDVRLLDREAELHNGDGLCYYDLQKQLVGMAANRVEPLSRKGDWRIYPKDELSTLPDLRAGVSINRNRDMAWVRLLEKPSSERRIGVWMRLQDISSGLRLNLTDETGLEAHADLVTDLQIARDASRHESSLREHLSKLGNTPLVLLGLDLQLSQAWFVPASSLNTLRRDAVEALLKQREQHYQRPRRGTPVSPPAQYPEDTLTYLANVYNHPARDFYREHGVNVIAAAYESHEETGEVSLMITKHCVRWSMSLCPKQAKGVTGVQGTIRAEPLTLINGSEKLTLRFDCKPCEMHVMGSMKKSVQQQRRRDLESATEVPMTFYRQRPGVTA